MWTYLHSPNIPVVHIKWHSELVAVRGLVKQLVLNRSAKEIKGAKEAAFLSSL